MDPLRRVEEVFPPEFPSDTDEDVRIRPILEHCESTYNNIWLGMYTYINTLFFTRAPTVSLRFGIVYGNTNGKLYPGILLKNTYTKACIYCKDTKQA